MFSEHRGRDKKNAVRLRIEDDEKEKESKILMFHGPLGVLERQRQEYADNALLIECQIAYIKAAMAATEETNFTALYEEYKELLEAQASKLKERYEQGLLFRGNDTEGKALSEEERRRLVEHYESQLVEQIQPFYAFILSAGDNFLSVLKEKERARAEMEALMEEISAKKTRMGMAMMDEEMAYEEARKLLYATHMSTWQQPLIQACEQGDFPRVHRLIAEQKMGKWRPKAAAKSYLNNAQEGGFYALHVLIADYKNDERYNLWGDKKAEWIRRNKGQALQIAQFLVAEGAALDPRNQDGYTPLHLAAKHNHEEMAIFLLKQGVNPSVQANKGDGYNRTPLHFAAYNGCEGIVRWLIKFKADVSAVTTEEDGCKTPLHEAAARGHFAIVQCLVEAGAEVNARDGRGRTPLTYTTWIKKDAQIAQYLLANGAQVEEEGDNSLTSLLQEARGDNDLVNVLIEHAVAFYAKTVETIKEKEERQEKIKSYKESLHKRYHVADFNDVDPTVQLHIFSWLDYPGRMAAATVCHYWQSLVHDERLSKHAAPLLKQEEITAAIAYMNAHLTECVPVLPDFEMHSDWKVIRIMPIKNDNAYLLVRMQSLTEAYKYADFSLPATVIQEYAKGSQLEDSSQLIKPFASQNP